MTMRGRWQREEAILGGGETLLPGWTSYSGGVTTRSEHGVRSVAACVRVLFAENVSAAGGIR